LQNLNREIEKIHINKKNFIEVPIDPDAKVEDTFGYDGAILVIQGQILD